MSTLEFAVQPVQSVQQSHQRQQILSALPFSSLLLSGHVQGRRVQQDRQAASMNMAEQKPIQPSKHTTPLGTKTSLRMTEEHESSSAQLALSNRFT